MASKVRQAFAFVVVHHVVYVCFLFCIACISMYFTPDAYFKRHFLCSITSMLVGMQVRLLML